MGEVMDSQDSQQEEHGLDKLLGLMQSAIESGDFKISNLFQEEKSDIENVVTQLKAILAKPDHTAVELNDIIQDSDVGKRIETHPLPNFITDSGFTDALCSLKIYNRVKFKEAILSYAGNYSASAAKSLKKKDERELFIRTILFYGVLEESAFANGGSLTKTYDLSLEYRFIQFALNSIGVDCPTRHNKFLDLCKKIDDPLPQTKQLMKIIDESTEYEEHEYLAILCIDHFFRFLEQNSHDALTDLQKNGVIAYMSVFAAFTQTNLHYLYAISMGHDWLFEHTQYASKRYKAENDTNEKFDANRIIKFSFDANNLIAPYIISTTDLTHGIIANFSNGKLQPSRYISLMEYIVLNSRCFILELKRLVEQQSSVNKLLNLHTKTAIDIALDRIIRSIQNLETCSLIDDSNESDVKNIIAFPDKLRPKISSIENQYDLVPMLESSLGKIAKYSAEAIPLINKEVKSLKESVDECMKSMDVEGAKAALDGLSEQKERFKENLSQCSNKLDELANQVEEKIEAESDKKVPTHSLNANESAKIEQLERDLLETMSDAEEKQAKLININAKLESECASLKAKLSNQSNNSGLSEAITKVLFQRPSSPKTIDVVTAIQEMFPHVVFADDVRKIAASNIYEHPQKLFDYMVRICNDYYPQINNGVSDSVAKNCLGSNYSQGESDTVMKNEKLRALRSFRFHGKKVDIPKHITIGSRHDRRATIQVYFDIFDGVLHIGYVGEHLQLK